MQKGVKKQLKCIVVFFKVRPEPTYKNTYTKLTN